MTYTLRKRVAILLACLLIPSLSSCNNSSTQQAERCMNALSIVQSADSLHATISQDLYSEDESETNTTIEYWKSKDNSFSSMSPVGESFRLLYLKMDDVYYSKVVYDEPVPEGVVYQAEWTEDAPENTPSDPDAFAFWQKFNRTAEDLTLVSQEKNGDNEVLTFQIGLSDEEKQADDGSQISDLVVFTLGEGDALLEFECRFTVTVDAGSTQGSATWMNHAVFEDTDSTTIQESIDAEWWATPHITNHTDSLDATDLSVIWLFVQDAIETKYGTLYSFENYDVEFSNDHIEGYTMIVDIDISVDMIDNRGQADLTGIVLQVHFPYDNITAKKMTLYWREEINSEVYLSEFDTAPIES